jgi:hypothetical protein
VSSLAPKVLTEDEKRALLRELERQRERLQSDGPDGEAARAELRAFEERAKGRAMSAAKRRRDRSQSSDAQSSDAQSSDAQGDEAGPPAAGPPEGVRVVPGARSGQAVEAGSGHDEEPLGETPRVPKPREFETVAAYAPDQGGPSEAEIVRRAARQGFVEPAYRRMYLEYESVEEAVLARDHVPEGYRTRVLRYFDLIGPGAQAE